MATCGWCNAGQHKQCLNGHRPIHAPECTCQHGGVMIEYEYNTPPQGRLAIIMAKQEKTEKPIKQLQLATDGRDVADFDNLEERRMELSAQYGKREFSRAAVGAYMGVPGPTIQRIERATPKTSGFELEQLEKALDELEAKAEEAAARAAEEAEEAADADEA